jgi:hypothetical protein
MRLSAFNLLQWNTRYHLNVLWDFADGSLFKG